MKRNKLLFIMLLFMIGTSQIHAQISSTSDDFVAHPIPDRTVSFSVSDAGEKKPIIWGLDMAWFWDVNIIRGIAFMGKENINIIRSSFTPTSELIDGELPQRELRTLNNRINLVNRYFGTDMNIVLNSDHPSVDPWFLKDPENWAALIDVTARHHEEAGHTVVTVSPFNEPDYGWGQGSKNDFYNIAKELRENPRFADHFANIRISGGNTLSTDEALPWYNHLKDVLDEGNTHQLAGSFDSYANFYETVRANGHHATNDELHNVMEAMVGVEYGMQTGIWWGTAELARGEFVKASNGERLGYAEHRPNWTAASVYRTPEGKIQAFGGASERQASTTTYRFVSKDRDVFYDGHGPQREYTLEMPGGNGYQNNQSNAEKVINITWGDDIQPVINGLYKVVNRNSGMVLEVTGGSNTAGTNIRQNNYANGSHQEWYVNPVDSRIGGDFSYFTFRAGHSNHQIDVENWSLEHGGNIMTWTNTAGGNQQWYLEYAEDGWFYIRNRYSSHCIEITNSSEERFANVQQGEKDGGAHQQWRFLPINAEIEFDAPSAPSNLTATANATSIQLNWIASPEDDVEGYIVFRSESANGPYNTIARNVTTTSFVDNTTNIGEEYFYRVKAIDQSLNRSEYSNEVSGMPIGGNDMLTHLQFEENLRDNTINLNHGASSGDISYSNGKIGTKALSLNGTNAFVQLPTNIANHQEITVAMWVYSNATTAWQRLFEFGNDENETMYLTPRSDSKLLTFTIKNNGEEQSLEGDAAIPIGKWTHVAVTLSSSEARLYMNGELVDSSDDMTISPKDFKPIFNYIGRGQVSSNPLFKGYIDDFRVYNYALSDNEIAEILEYTVGIEDTTTNNENTLAVWPIPANDVLNVSYSGNSYNNSSNISLYNMNGKSVINKNMESNYETELNVSHLSSGIYILKLTNKNETLVRKIIIKH